MSRQLWIAGQYIGFAGGAQWAFQGVFSSEVQAIAACFNARCFIAPALLDEELPEALTPWVGAYYPLLEVAAKTITVDWLKNDREQLRKELDAATASLHAAAAGCAEMRAFLEGFVKYDVPYQDLQLAKLILSRTTLGIGWRSPAEWEKLELRIEELEKHERIAACIGGGETIAIYQGNMKDKDQAEAFWVFDLCREHDVNCECNPLRKQLAEAKASVERWQYIYTRARQMWEGDVGVLKLEASDLKTELAEARKDSETLLDELDELDEWCDERRNAPDVTTLGNVQGKIRSLKAGFGAPRGIACKYDNDGDGNCHIHPEGCPK